MVMLNAIPMDDYIGEHIENFLSKKKNKSVSINTYKTYRSSLNQIFKDLFGTKEYKFITKNQIESLKLNVLEEYFIDLSEQLKEDGTFKYKNATINNRISTIKELLKYLKSRRIIEYEISDLDELESFPDTREEIEMIPYDLAMEYIKYFKKEDQGLEKSLIIKLAIETALRASELLSLEWSNFTVVEDGVILKSHGYNKGKGNKEWIDKIDKKLYEELLELKEIGNTKKLFTLIYKQLVKIMDDGNELINNTELKYTFHSFKKLAVTMCYLNSGNCIYTAMKKARHSNVNTTMRYLRLTNLNVTGIISSNMNTNEDIYKAVSHEVLLDALGEMRPEMLLLLNNKIKNMIKM